MLTQVVLAVTTGLADLPVCMKSRTCLDCAVIGIHDVGQEVRVFAIPGKRFERLVERFPVRVYSKVTRGADVVIGGDKVWGASYNNPPRWAMSATI